MIDAVALSHEEKIRILMGALEERYRSIHGIRKRVQETGVWALGVMLGAGAWIVTAQSVPTDIQKAAYIGAVVATLVLVRFCYLRDLCAGFKAQQHTAARIEGALGLFTPGAFIADSMYPTEWKSAGTEDGEGRFFRTSYWLVYAATGFVVLAIGLKGVIL